MWIFVYMHIFAPCMCLIPVEVQKAHWFSLEWRQRWLWATCRDQESNLAVWRSNQCSKSPNRFYSSQNPCLTEGREREKVCILFGQLYTFFSICTRNLTFKEWWLLKWIKELKVWLKLWNFLCEKAQGESFFYWHIQQCWCLSQQKLRQQNQT